MLQIIIFVAIFATITTAVPLAQPLPEPEAKSDPQLVKTIFAAAVYPPPNYQMMMPGMPMWYESILNIKLNFV